MPHQEITLLARRWPWAVGVVLLCGCQSMPSQNYSAWRLSDPASSSPYRLPLAATPNSGSPTGGTNTLQKPAGPETKTNADSGLAATDPNATTREKPDSPELSSTNDSFANSNERTRSNSPVKLTVSDPAKGKIDDLVSFRTTVTNTGKVDLTDLEVICDFDPELIFPGETTQQLQQPIDRLDAGESRVITLALKVQEFGQPCVLFRLRLHGFEDVVEKRCLTIDPPPLELSWQGPEERPVNSRAEFVLTLLNRSPTELRETELIVAYDPSLAVRAGSAGVVRRPQELVWNLGLLKVNERVRIEMEFECLEVVDPSMLRVQLRSQGTAVATSEHRLNITRSTDIIGRLPTE